MKSPGPQINVKNVSRRFGNFVSIRKAGKESKQEGRIFSGESTMAQFLLIRSDAIEAIVAIAGRIFPIALYPRFTRLAVLSAE